MKKLLTVVAEKTTFRTVAPEKGGTGLTARTVQGARRAQQSRGIFVRKHGITDMGGLCGRARALPVSLNAGLSTCTVLPALLTGGSGTSLSSRCVAMAHEPACVDASSSNSVPDYFNLKIDNPTPGKVWEYVHLASGPNAALAIAAAMESVDESHITELMSSFAASAEYQLLKQCYRNDQRYIHTEDPSDAAEREEFILDLVLSRMFLAGVRYAALPKEVRNAA